MNGENIMIIDDLAIGQKSEMKSDQMNKVLTYIESAGIIKL